MATATVPTYGDIYDQIKAGQSTAYTPKYQTTDGLSSLTSNYMDSMQPIWQSTKTGINQQYDNSEQSGLDFMANKGLSRSGANYDNMQTNNQNRNNAIGSAYGDFTNTATTNALNAANLGLTEQNLIQDQKSDAVSQLSNLLSQYQTDQYNNATLTGTTATGQQTLAAQELANKIAQQTIANQLSEAELLGNYNGQQTVGQQELNLNANKAVNDQAAAMMAAYLENSGTATVPDSVITWINQMFS